MKINYSYFFALIVLNVLAGFTAQSQCPAATFNLDTYYASNNGQRGCMFDIAATQDITITCFDANLYAGTTGNYEIYYRNGSFVGNESNAAAWTFVGSTTGLPSAGGNLPTTIPIPVNVFIASGQTCSFYVTNDFGAGTSYTDGLAANTVLGSDAYITITGGIGKSYPFGLTFNYREFNGTAHYNLGSPLDVSLTSFEAQSENRSVYLKWETASENNNDYFTLERSLDAVNWITIAEIEGAGTSTEANSYSFVDENIQSKMAYYRLSQTDFDGTVSDYSVRAVKIENSMPAHKLTVAPNPSSDYAHIMLMADEMGPLTISGLNGQLVSVEYSESASGVILDVRKLDAGIYIVKVNEQSALLRVM